MGKTKKDRPEGKKRGKNSFTNGHSLIIFFRTHRLYPVILVDTYQTQIFMEITYTLRKDIPVNAVIAVLESSGINRPTEDPARIEAMFQAADLIVSAWHGDQLVGIARSLTDFCYCCYLSDLAVRKEYQSAGIGKELVARTRREIGPQSMLLLLAAPSAVDYYPKLGMEKMERAFIYNREH